MDLRAVIRAWNDPRFFQKHHVAHFVVVLDSAVIFTLCIFVNEGLFPLFDFVPVRREGNRKDHVSSEDKLSRSCFKCGVICASNGEGYFT